VMSTIQQGLGQMRADESCASRDQNSHTRFLPQKRTVPRPWVVQTRGRWMDDPLR
jgi:hypothetical protein